ncbi:MAG: L-threonylcarbamoyladenylate synthase [Patescibacteria group bacterium]
MKIVRLSDQGVDRAAKSAAQILAKGGIVLFPTDTLYGLAVDATNPKAIARFRELKGREKKKPISVIVPDTGSIKDYAQMNETAERLAEKFLPGALTLVMKATRRIPAELTLNGAVGIRIPDDPFCLALAKAFTKPFTATSANRSGRETPDTVAGVIDQFGHLASGIALAIDDGDRKGRKPSTVVTTVDGEAHIMREGAITREELYA